MYRFLEKHKVLNQNQYGFRNNSSTAFAIYDLIENKLKNLDENLYTCALYVDLSKAFDTVNHNILLKKLEHHGIRGVPLDLLKSYLSNRKQYTYVNGSKSCEFSIDIGVPQRSVLGPSYFCCVSTTFLTHRLYSQNFLQMTHVSSFRLQLLTNFKLLLTVKCLKFTIGWLATNFR